MVTKKSTVTHLMITISLFIFQFIYQLFGHGIHSAFLTYSFVLPMVVTVSYSVLLWRHLDISQLAFYLVNSGEATMVIGFIMRGIFVIAGTASNYVLVYWLIGGLMLLVGFITSITSYYQVKASHAKS